jgi:hypothetical protein
LPVYDPFRIGSGGVLRLIDAAKGHRRGQGRDHPDGRPALGERERIIGERRCDVGRPKP